MATVQISQTTPQPPLQFSSTDDLKLRAWYTNDFIAADGITPVLGWSGQGQGFYYEITCALNNGDLVIPAFDVEPTTESNPTAGFFGQLYVNGAPRDMIFGYGAAGAGWQIPTIYGSVVSFADLVAYNRAMTLLMPPVTFFTANQVIAEIRRIALLGDLTAGTIPVASGSTSLADSLITDDGTNIGAQTLGFVQMGDFQNPFAGGGSRLEISDTFNSAKLFAGADSGNEYAGVWGQCGVTSAELYAQTTGQTHVYGTAQETWLGDARNDGNGVQIRIYNHDLDQQMISQCARNQTPDDTQIFVEEICWFLDQNSGKLKARIRLDDGTYATWEGAYTPD